jgi:uncharacterized membrane protein YoaK (UPF0700 family)
MTQRGDPEAMSSLLTHPRHRRRRDITTAFLSDVREMVLPGQTVRHGPLPPLLISMTLVTGLVDAFSYLVLGHVFVANMTGNVVFLAFALAGARGFSITASVAAMAAFALGALIGGRLSARHRDHRAWLHSSAAAAQAAFVGASVILAIASGGTPSPGYRYALIGALGIAMGIQNAAARAIALPDLTTTVVTLTLTGIAADSALAGGAGSRAGRRLVPVATMLGGAALGAALIRHAQGYDPLIIALGIVITGAAVSRLLGRGDPVWVRTSANVPPPSKTDSSH